MTAPHMVFCVRSFLCSCYIVTSLLPCVNRARDSYECSYPINRDASHQQNDDYENLDSYHYAPHWYFVTSPVKKPLQPIRSPSCAYRARFSSTRGTSA